jgi:hypothetical protein
MSYCLKISFIVGFLSLTCSTTCFALTGGRLVGLIKGTEQERAQASSFIQGVVQANNEINYCEPYLFEPEKIFGALEIHLTYSPIYREWDAKMLINNIMKKLTPCRLVKSECMCISSQSK